MNPYNREMQDSIAGSSIDGASICEHRIFEVRPSEGIGHCRHCRQWIPVYWTGKHYVDNVGKSV